MLGRRFVGMKAEQAQAYTLLMTALAGVLGILINLLPDMAALAVCALLPPSTAALLLRPPASAGPSPASQAQPQPSQSSPEQQAAWERRRRALINIIICCLVYSAIYNMVLMVAYEVIPAGTGYRLRFTVNLVTALGLLALALFLRPLSSTEMLRLVLPVTAVGFVLYLVVPSALAWLPLAVSAAGRKLFDILTWVLVAQAVTAYALPPDRYFGFLIAAKNMGYLLGRLFAVAALAYDVVDAQAVTLIPILMLVLIVLFVWVMPERTVDELFGVVDPPKPEPADDIDARASLLAAECGCTPRETEVLALLARGRTQAVIARKLGVSKGTAHTHIAHVYQKLGVNSQQDLIEKVENANTQLNVSNQPEE